MALKAVCLLAMAGCLQTMVCQIRCRFFFTEGCTALLSLFVLLLWVARPRVDDEKIAPRVVHNKAAHRLAPLDADRQHYIDARRPPEQRVSDNKCDNTNAGALR